MITKASGEVVYQVNARISQRAFDIAQKYKIPYSKTLDDALLQKGEEHES
jgi:hypothetical protein